MLRGYLQTSDFGAAPAVAMSDCTTQPTQISRRIVVALDVRSNDDGDLVVTKGDQYDMSVEARNLHVG